MLVGIKKKKMAGKSASYPVIRSPGSVGSQLFGLGEGRIGFGSPSDGFKGEAFVAPGTGVFGSKLMALSYHMP
jgi:hypothetical protein